MESARVLRNSTQSEKEPLPGTSSPTHFPGGVSRSLALGCVSGKGEGRPAGGAPKGRVEEGQLGVPAGLSPTPSAAQGVVVERGAGEAPRCLQVWPFHDSPWVP